MVVQHVLPVILLLLLLLGLLLESLAATVNVMAVLYAVELFLLYLLLKFLERGSSSIGEVSVGLAAHSEALHVLQEHFMLL